MDGDSLLGESIYPNCIYDNVVLTSITAKANFKMKIVKILLAIFLPPVAAVMQVGVSTHFWINIALTLIGGIPGIIHALWLILTNQTK